MTEYRIRCTGEKCKQASTSMSVAAAALEIAQRQGFIEIDKKWKCKKCATKVSAT